MNPYLRSFVFVRVGKRGVGVGVWTAVDGLRQAAGLQGIGVGGRW